MIGRMTTESVTDTASALAGNCRKEDGWQDATPSEYDRAPREQQSQINQR